MCAYVCLFDSIPAGVTHGSITVGVLYRFYVILMHEYHMICLRDEMQGGVSIFDGFRASIGSGCRSFTRLHFVLVIYFVFFFLLAIIDKKQNAHFLWDGKI